MSNLISMSRISSCTLSLRRNQVEYRSSTLAIPNSHTAIGNLKIPNLTPHREVVGGNCSIQTERIRQWRTRATDEEKADPGSSGREEQSEERDGALERSNRDSKNEAETDERVAGEGDTRVTEDVSPSLSSSDAPLQIPRDVIEKLRSNVFSFDTFFVTSVDNYGENGVIFRGNVRSSADPIEIQSKLSLRLQEAIGNKYQLFLLEDQDGKPVAVVVPEENAVPTVNSSAEFALALGLAGVTIVSTLNTFGAQLFNAALLVFKFDQELVGNAVPGTLAVLVILVAHELGHSVAAQRQDLKLAPPILIPAGLGLLGSFGSITRIKGIVKNRNQLASVAVAGPLAGSAVSFGIMLLGLFFTARGMGGIEVDSSSFKDSFLIGALCDMVFGDRVFTAATLNCNPLFVAGWSGLIINAINSIPAGELDGAKAFLGLFGRRATSRMSVASLFILGILGFSSSLGLFWLLFVLSLQRGPILPCSEELSPIPENSEVKWASIFCLVLPLLILLPFPFGSNPAFDSGVIPTF